MNNRTEKIKKSKGWKKFFDLRIFIVLLSLIGAVLCYFYMGPMANEIKNRWRDFKEMLAELKDDVSG